MELPAVNLKAIILVHWLLTVWGCMSYMFPASYAWGNFSVLAVGIWAIVQRDSLDAIMMFLAGLLLTVLTDIIHISVFYPPNNHLTDEKRFSAGMAIFSLLLKPVSCYLLYRMYRERGGEYSLTIGVPHAGQDRSAYESIDQQDAPPQWPNSSKTPPSPSEPSLTQASSSHLPSDGASPAAEQSGEHLFFLWPP